MYFRIHHSFDMELDYYKILGVSRSANLSEITNAYHAHASLWHPANFVNDSPDNAEFAKTRYKEIEEAYRVLSDPSSRAEYDRRFSKVPFDSGKSVVTSKWKDWIIPACGALLMFFIPRTCDSIKSYNNELINKEKNKQRIELLKVPSQTPYKQGYPQIDVPKLDIPEIEMPKIDKRYSPGTSFEHLGNYDSGVSINKPLNID